jgi:hypothetical protein
MLTFNSGIRMAARKLGLERMYLDEVEDWDGTTEFLEVDFNKETPSNKPLEPSNAVQEIYEEATPYLDML